jgi:hypothetical protein
MSNQCQAATKEGHRCTKTATKTKVIDDAQVSVCPAHFKSQNTKPYVAAALDNEQTELNEVLREAETVVHLQEMAAQNASEAVRQGQVPSNTGNDMVNTAMAHAAHARLLASLAAPPVNGVTREKKKTPLQALADTYETTMDPELVVAEMAHLFSPESLHVVKTAAVWVQKYKSSKKFHTYMKDVFEHALSKTTNIGIQFLVKGDRIAELALVHIYDVFKSVINNKCDGAMAEQLRYYNRWHELFQSNVFASIRLADENKRATVVPILKQVRQAVSGQGGAATSSQAVSTASVAGMSQQQMMEQMSILMRAMNQGSGEEAQSSMRV